MFDVHVVTNALKLEEARNELKQESPVQDVTVTVSEGSVFLRGSVNDPASADCAAAGASNPCFNRNQYVFTKLLAFGNRASVQTSLGSPTSNYFQPGSIIQLSDYLNNKSLVATNFPSLGITFVPGQPGQYAYVSEVTLHMQFINWNTFSNTGSYARSVF